MYLDTTNKQWLSEITLDGFFFGEKMVFALLHQGVEFLHKGTVLVFTRKTKPIMMFQLKSDHSLKALRDYDFCAEAGSIVWLEDDETIIGETINFGCCRMPTKEEFDLYEGKETV